MSHHDDAWWRHPRIRIRHDAHLWIRPDIARWMRGVDPADVFPSLARDRAQAEAAKERARAAEDAELDAFIARERREQAAIQAELNEVKEELVRRREAEAKYSPSQPRIPAGNPRGGQWTDGSGGHGEGTSLTQPMGNVDIGDVSGSSELGDLFRIRPDDARVDGVRVAANDRSLEINSGELINRHMLDEHIGKTDEELIARIRRSQLRGFIYTIGMDRNGSFDSIESARDLVSQTLRANSEAALQVASGEEKGLFLTYRFGFRTGKEAYLDINTSRISIRPTYDVGIEIVHDESRSSGYRVVSAYPRNYNPRIGR